MCHLFNLSYLTNLCCVSSSMASTLWKSQLEGYCPKPPSQPRLQTRRGWSKSCQISLGLKQMVEPRMGVGWLLVQKEKGMPLLTFLPLLFLSVCLGSLHQCINACLCECVRAWASTPCLLFRLHWACSEAAHCERRVILRVDDGMYLKQRVTERDTERVLVGGDTKRKCGRQRDWEETTLEFPSVNGDQSYPFPTETESCLFTSIMLL